MYCGSIPRRPSSFLSTPSARRATNLDEFGEKHTVISIHALREEGDVAYTDAGFSVYYISIHALREEGDALPSTTPC